MDTVKEEEQTQVPKKVHYNIRDRTLHIYRHGPQNKTEEIQIEMHEKRRVN